VTAAITAPQRPDIAAAIRVVVKIGSSSLTTPDGEIADDRICALAAALAARRAPNTQNTQNTQLVLVSSGAIRSGCPAAPATWPPSRPPPASARACSSRGTPPPSTGTASAPARSCCPPTT
jgi:hypothetical protein